MGIRDSKNQALLAAAGIYLIALAAACTVVLLLPEDLLPLWKALAGNAAATLVVYSASRITGNASLYDPYWSAAPPVIFLYWMGELSIPVLILFLFITTWSVRLTWNWAHRWKGMDDEDWRYRELRQYSGKWFALVELFGIMLFPTIQVFIAMVPVYVLLSSPGYSLSWMVIGLTVIALGVWLEYLADVQMDRFKQSGAGGVMRTGLWAISRHPNYLGEILFWFGTALCSLGSPNATFLLLACPAWMLLMFLGISIPWIERKIISTRPQYRQVQQEIPVLIPVIKIPLRSSEG